MKKYYIFEAKIRRMKPANIPYTGTHLCNYQKYGFSLLFERLVPLMAGCIQIIKFKIIS